jgi:hypothetical protein
MNIDFNLPSLPVPRLTEAILRKRLKELQEISLRNKDRYNQGIESKPFKDSKNKLIQRLKSRSVKGESFRQVTNVVGRERLLLSIYLEHFGHEDAKKWLPPFDNRIALSLLGQSGSDWHPGRRRQVTLLFFTHYDRLAALSLLCTLLLRAYTSPKSGEFYPAKAWHEQRKTIFSLNGPSLVASQATSSDKFSELMERFGVPNSGRFAEKLRQVTLLNAIRNAPFGSGTDDFEKIELSKEERADSTKLMGSAALEIMIQRVATEGGRKWTGDWPRWITRFGCDPRYGRATLEGAKWWGWATDEELRLAQQGVTGLTLRFFIEFLKSSLVGTSNAMQFDLRSKFLLALFEAGKIQDARLVLNRSTLRRLDQKYHDSWVVARLNATTDQMSMICLRCTDDIHIIEGTHTFGLRMFHRNFPIRGFWERADRSYNDRDFRISPADCPVFLRHIQSGAWLTAFFAELRTKFHIEWNDVNLR